MKLIIVLAVMGLQRYLNVHFSLAEFDWFKPYREFITKTVGKSDVMSGHVGMLILVLPVAFVVLILDTLFSRTWFLELVFGSAVLFYCIDARDLHNLLPEYFKAKGDKDNKKAQDEVTAFLGHTVPKSGTGFARSVTEGVFIQSLHKVFSTLFWFMLVGPFGAVLYFMISTVFRIAHAPKSDMADFAEASAMQVGVMNWMPVRLVGLSYALVGSFGAVFKRWLANIVTGLDTADRLAVEFGVAALDEDPEKTTHANVEENESALDLVFRSQIVWVVAVAIIAVLTL